MLLKKIFFIFFLLFSTSVSAGNISNGKNIYIKKNKNFYCLNILKSIKLNFLNYSKNFHLYKNKKKILKLNNYINFSKNNFFSLNKFNFLKFFNNKKIVNEIFFLNYFKNFYIKNNINNTIFLKKIISLHKLFFFHKNHNKKYLSNSFFLKNKFNNICNINFLNYKNNYIQKKLNIFKNFNFKNIFNRRNIKNFHISTSYDKDKGLFLQLLLLEKNIFNTNNELYFRILKNFIDTKINIYLIKSLTSFKDFFLKSDAFINHFKENNYSKKNYINKLFGFCSLLSSPIKNNKKFSMSLGYQNIKLSYISPHINLFQYLSSISKKFSLKTKRNTFFINDFFVKYMFDFNNIKEKNFFKNGVHAKILGKLSLPLFDNFYNKIFLKIHQYTSFKNLFNLVIHNVLELGFGSSLGKNVYPFYENYKFSKKNLRSGFKDNSIGPTAIYYKLNYNNIQNKEMLRTSKFYPSTDYLGGNEIIHLNTELLFPKVKVLYNFFKCFQIGFFSDIIRIVDHQWDNRMLLYSINKKMNFINPNKLYFSVGSFARLITSLGPISVTFSLPICPNDFSDSCFKKFMY
ncbi:BamA/TamA family outer membrane protein [Buchnera aphidicola]|uniref:Outer membrane protein n=1 Tax=Buchnera aphidicola subsp. Cinara cedri (strain Cc) TaxID=372461 RepID=Q057S7_BUCCC|nr:BamA/TamA family outer membrane protein [Buchnera aphidicola]ABJ90622.1 outer membrane protein precursor [Buchnera aphidicola BCc]